MASEPIEELLVRALALHRQEQLAPAEALYREILAREPGHADAWHLLGVIAHQLGQHEAAVACFGHAIAIDATVADYHNNLAVALERLHRLDKSAAACRVALGLNPSFPEAHNNLGNVLLRLDRTDEAVQAYIQAIRLNPRYADAHCNLGVALKDRGELDGAIAAFRNALRLRPDFAKAHSHLIFTLHYHPATDAALLGRELGAWRTRFGDPLRPAQTMRATLRKPRLRIGYVSPDFRAHAVGRFLLPPFRHHDHEQFEICCYSDVAVPDALTVELRGHADRWHDIVGLGDAALAEKIRADRVDILVDLTLHTGRNRLLVFARQPAPVQVTYLAYCGSSGLATMHYRITDPYLDPADADLSGYSETSVPLPDTYWCFQPIDDSPAVTPLPAVANGKVTLGCLNNFCKITDPTVETWAIALRALPGARLVLHATEGQHRARVLAQLAAAGVVGSRVDFIGHLPLHDYLAAYQRIDLALDPFPYGGGTTTCDALWMGVPIVTLAGRIAVARAGSSILHNVGLPELVARTPAGYVDRIVALARDLPALAKLRATLRGRMRGSPLMDAPRFTRNLEAAYQRMWKQTGTAN